MRSIFGKIKGPLKIYLRWPVYGAVFFAVVNAIMYFIDLRAAVVFSAALFIYLVLLAVFMITKHNFFTRNIIEFASGYAQMQKRMMDDLMVPYGLLDESGHIIWLNNAFTEIVSKEDYHKGLASIFPEVGELDFAAGLDKMNEVSLKFGGRDYRLVIESVDMSGIDMDAGMVDADENTRIYAMYLFDETEINECRKELHDERCVVGLIYIDNYDEALESIDEVRRSLLIALVDRKINKYVSGGNGIVKKLEKDKYLVVFRYRFLEQLREDRFSVLEEVKSVNIGNEMSVTLSIGIGAMNGTYLKNYDMARAAIDLALGRGGDRKSVV